MKVMEIKQKIDRKGNKTFYVDGEKFSTSDWYLLSRKLTGTTSEDGEGVFTREGKREGKKVRFYHGQFCQDFEFEPLNKVLVENEEILQERVDQVREWVNSLKEKETHIHLRYVG